jgi:hypothetical protein
MERLSVPPEKARTPHPFALLDREVQHDVQSTERDHFEGEDASCRAFPTAR